MKKLELQRSVPLYERVSRLRDAFSSDDPEYIEIIDIVGDVANLQVERDALRSKLDALRDAVETFNRSDLLAPDTFTSILKAIEASREVAE